MQNLSNYSYKFLLLFILIIIPRSVMGAHVQAPIISPIPDQIATQNTTYTLNLASYVTAGSKPIGSYTLDGTLPTGLSFSTSTGLLSGTPTSTGSYSLTLTAKSTTNKTSDPQSFTLTVNGSNNSPTASFTTSITDLKVDFTDTSIDYDGNIASWSWDFGDGNSATSQHPSHTYASADTYTVELTVTDNDGDTGTDTVVITVSANPTPPNISGIPDQTVVVNTVFTDLNLSTYTTEADGDTITYTTTTLPHGLTLSGSIISGTPTVIGLTTVTVTAADNDGNTTDSFDINVTAAPATSADLEITKTAIQGGIPITTVEINATFDYVIDVENNGPDAAQNIVVTDTLPTGITLNTITAPDWTCVNNFPDINCTHTGDLASGSTHVITLNVDAPATADYITNEANVTSDNDPDTSNNSSSVDVNVVDTDLADDLCYSNSDGSGTRCGLAGDFYYASATNGTHGCVATAAISNISVDSLPVSNVYVYKLYDPSASGTGISSSTRVTDYGSEYTNNLGTINYDANSSISDTDITGSIDDIILYATYVKDGISYAGEINPCEGQISTSLADKSDIITLLPNVTFDTTLYNNGSQKYITTKVAADTPVTLTGVHLNATTLDAEAYLPSAGNNTWNMTIIPFLSNGTCTSMENVIDPSTGTQLLIDIPYGSTTANGQMTVTSVVSQDSRFQMVVVDPQTLSVDGQQCILNSSTSGNFARVAQCANAEIQYTRAFGQAAWNRCGLDSGKPCVSRNHGDADTSDPTYDPATDSIYDNELGCYICTFNITPDCSTDNFAIRPELFEMSMSDTDGPNLLRAGEDYAISLTAKDAADNVPAEYTVTDHNFNTDLDSNVTRYFSDNTIDASNILHGTSTVDTSTTAYMVNGLSSLATTGPVSTGVADDIVNVSYDDVGKINLFVYDENWAAVDNDDTPMDCNSSVHTYICGDMNVTYIPHHFQVDNIHLRNHRDTDFTYLSNDLNMSAHIDVTISAMNKDNVITQNFQQGSLYYENPVSVDLNVTEWSGTATRHPAGNSVHKHDISTPTLLGFGGVDANGTHTIDWNETNATQQVMFNYDRQYNQTVNPFEVNGTDINITVQSTYTDASTPSSPAVISGTGTGDRNATFIFARAKVADQDDFYDNITVASVNTDITILLYCRELAPSINCPGIDTINGLTNDSDWWLSWDHNENLQDGNITLVSPPNKIAGGAINTPTVTTNVDILSEGKDDNVTVTRGGTDVPMTVGINLDTTLSTDTSSWLIYNPTSASSDPVPFYRVRFIGGTSNWTGYGETGHVIDSNASRQINKRLGW